MIKEEIWNFEPTKLYQPPYMRWDEIEISKENFNKEKVSILNCSEKYFNVMKELI